MIIIPAIDLYDGKVVRLVHGDYEQMTVYSDNPLEKAKEIEGYGAKWLHIVDLEGAKDGNTPAGEIIKEIVSNTKLKVEVGGGIRSIEVIEKYVSMGVERVIIGTRAIEDEEFLKEAISKFGDRIAVGCDAKKGRLATHGWKEDSGLELSEFVRKLIDLGVKTVIVTDIGRDGAMIGSNNELYKMLKYLGEIDIIASGGVSDYIDIEELLKIDMYGAIVGKAMYEGTIDIAKAIDMTKQ